MDISSFTEKNIVPNNVGLKHSMGKLYPEWQEICAYTFENNQGCREEWNYSKSGWNLRLKNDKRIIIYLMPLHKSFRASFVFGEKATKEAMETDISEDLKQLILSAPVYKEGRGFRVLVENKKIAADIKKLLQIKKKY